MMRDWAYPILRAEQRLAKAKNYLALAMNHKGATELAEAIDMLREALATVQVQGKGEAPINDGEEMLCKKCGGPTGLHRGPGIVAWSSVICRPCIENAT